MCEPKSPRNRKGMIMKTVNRIAASAIAASLALGVAMPASAAVYDRPGQIRAEIAQLDRQIDRAEDRRILSRREAAQLNAQVDRLQAMFRSYARGGFTRYELASLDTRLDAVKRQVAIQARDGNRFGRNDPRDDWRRR